LNLPAQITERVARLDGLKNLDTTTIVLAGYGFSGGFVSLGQAFDNGLFLLGASASSNHGSDCQKHCQAQQFCRARGEFLDDS
jgi:hypothetical protein